jgi:hypothetical protein
MVLIKIIIFLAYSSFLFHSSKDELEILYAGDDNFKNKSFYVNGIEAYTTIETNARLLDFASVSSFVYLLSVFFAINWKIEYLKHEIFRCKTFGLTVSTSQNAKSLD